jgi:hypothetical protein
VADCRYCGVEIFFAWHPDWLRWFPIEPESITGDEELHEDRGVVYERYHRRHRCEKWQEHSRASSSSSSGSNSYEPPRERRAPLRPVRTAHATLFVAPDAPIEVIRAAYKALAMLYHPDLGGDLERMVALNRAYEELVSEKGPR